MRTNVQMLRQFITAHTVEEDWQSTCCKAIQVAFTRALRRRQTVTQLPPHSPCII